MTQQHKLIDTPLNWRTSLATKFVGLSAIAVFMISSLNAYQDFNAQKDEVKDNLNAQIAMLGSLMTSIAADTLRSDDVGALNNYMKEIGNGQDFVYAAIFSPEGNAITSYLQRRNAFVSEIINDKNELDIRHVIDVLNLHPVIIHQRYPIIFNKNLLGTVELGISTGRYEEQNSSKFIGTLLVGTIFSLVFGFVIYGIYRRYSLRPILELEQGISRISKGELDAEVHVNSHDELGRLAVLFNRMLHQLKQANADKAAELLQIQQLTQSLELQVQESTRDLELVNQKLEKLALHDLLTNLPNRLCVQENLNRGIADAKLTGAVFAVIMMDLDRFKEINDTLGHDCGDQLLVEVGRRLQVVLRPTDLVGRLGGDEFAILLPDTKETGASIVAQKILVALERPFNLADMAFNVSASLGIAAYPIHGNTTSALLKAADVAMYHAKNNKLGYCIYKPISDVNTPDRLSLMTELRDAIQHDGLQLFYQPKVDLATRKIVGVEALLRWQHKDRGFIPPEEFIPMAEKSGLIRHLSYWVISTALLQLDAWHRAKLNVSLSINLSMHNLHDTDFPTQLAQLLDQTNVDNRFVQFEITESAIMNNPDYVMGVLAMLGKMNISFSIDDFGTGYSSLSNLKRLRVQEIKIDKSFVMDMATDTDDDAIVHSIIDMAHTLGLTVTAEGVESETIMNRLVELGCDMIQGYHISRPLPPERVTQLLRNPQLNLSETKTAETNLTVLKGKNS